ncbi:phage minor head protein [Neisseria leonii]|uniref:phage minor head protein n=1 Tax=Neisseria leonii TaxID=2995413 RepID=UPI00237C36D9|nr:phage minor head protein [Neisseria sp. 3986]MDD9325621.1 phage minor head protein [Neisseria sp. 3986]
MPQIKFALGLKPEAAVEWLKAKNVTAENYRHLTPSEIAKVYTIARMTNLDMLNDIKQSMVRAAENGQPFSAWKKELLNHLAAKGWLHPNGHNGQEITDPETGEVFGTPRRLDNLFRTNMQSAYSAAQYQSYMQNLDARPFWRYDAVNDHRTRAAHSAMDGLVYRYDDPFWATFYPPNGYRCRCSVTALSDRDIEREGRSISVSGGHNLTEAHKIYNKKGDSYKTVAYVAPDGTKITTDRGFDYNAGRMNYCPDLDKYDRALAHQFAKAEMAGTAFQAAFKQLEGEFDVVKKRLGLPDKITTDEKIVIRNTLSRKLRFAAGVFSRQTQEAADMKRATVWLSDDTLIKQIESRSGQKFGTEVYALLPDMIYEPEYLFQDGKNYILVRQGLMAVLKYIQPENEIFVQSYRGIGKDELNKLLERKKVIKAVR